MGAWVMGRLWHTLILAKWNKVFTLILMETLISLNEQKYYEAIEKSRDNIEPGIFIEFSVEMTYNYLSKLIKNPELL